MNDLLTDREPPPSRATLDAFQQDVGLTAPEVLRQLLEGGDGGTFKRNTFTLNGGRAVRLTELLRAELWRADFLDRIGDDSYPQNFIAFAVDVGGNEVGFLRDGGPQYPVYWWESDAGRFTRVCASLELFFAQLKAMDLYSDN